MGRKFTRKRRLKNISPAKFKGFKIQFSQTPYSTLAIAKKGKSKVTGIGTFRSDALQDVKKRIKNEG